MKKYLNYGQLVHIEKKEVGGIMMGTCFAPFMQPAQGRNVVSLFFLIFCINV